MADWGTSELSVVRLADEPVRWQRSLRWERPARDPRRIALGLLVGLFCTTLQLALFDAGMRGELHRVGAFAPDVAIEVELLDAPEVDVLLPEKPPVAEYPKARIPTGHRRPRAAEAPSIASDSGTQEPLTQELAEPLQLFGQDGQPKLPDSEPNASRKIFGAPDGAPLAHQSPIPYEPTRFDRMMPSARETLGGEIVRKTTFTHVWHTPWGTRIQCSTSLVMAGLGICGWGQEPRATADELRAMRADPPAPREPKPPGVE